MHRKHCRTPAAAAAAAVGAAAAAAAVAAAKMCSMAAAASTAVGASMWCVAAAAVPAAVPSAPSYADVPVPAYEPRVPDALRDLRTPFFAGQHAIRGPSDHVSRHAVRPRMQAVTPAQPAALLPQAAPPWPPCAWRALGVWPWLVQTLQRRVASSTFYFRPLMHAQPSF